MTDIVGLKCNGKSRCDISYDDPSIVATKECKTGLPMYTDIGYVCIPGEFSYCYVITCHSSFVSPGTIHTETCSAMQVTRQLQYVLSSDLWNQHCLYDVDQNVNMAFEANANLKIKLRLRPIKLETQSAVLVQYGTSEELAMDMNDDEIVEIPTDHLVMRISDKENIFMIGFQGGL